MPLTKATLYGAALLPFCLAAFPTLAEVPLGEAVEPAPEEPRAYYFVVNQPMADFVDILASDTGARVHFDSEIRARITNSQISGTIPEIMRWLEARHDVDHFAFNGTHYLSARDTAKTRVVRLGDLSADAARDALVDAGLSLTDFDLRTTAGGTAIALSGPPQLLAIAETIIEAVPATPLAAPPPTLAIRVRRGTELTLETVPEEG